MTTLMLLVVLGAGQGTVSERATPSDKTAQSDKAAQGAWLDDYGVALQRAKESGKPLLIVIDLPGNAAARVEQISYASTNDRSSAKGENGDSELLKYYVLCRVDAGSEYGQAVARAFGSSTLPYTAIIDKRAQSVLYAKAGQFTADEWTTTLTSYWRGERLVSYEPAFQAFQPAHCST